MHNKRVFTTFRSLHAMIVIMVILSLIFAVAYLEGVLYLDPCPLCMVDRMILGVLALLSGIALLLGPRIWLVWSIGGLQLISGLAGIAVAGRHIYLQNLPRDQVPECGPDLFFMLEAFPMSQVMQTLFSGSGQCADISWRFFGLTLPAQTLILFVVLTVLAIVAFFSGVQARQMQQ